MTLLICCDTKEQIKMMKVQSTFNYLQSQLLLISQQQFTGKLEVRVSQNYHWSLYWHLGRLVWAFDSVHAARRWSRQTSQAGKMINVEDIRVRPTDKFNCRAYHVLAVLAKRKVLRLEQAVQVIQGTIREILFDIFQKLEQDSHGKSAIHQNGKSTYVPEFVDSQQQAEIVQLEYYPGLRPSNNVLLPPSCMVEVATVLKQTQQDWENWLKADLIDFSANLVPVIKDEKLLQQKTSAGVYQNLVKLVNGQNTLRDIAAITKQDVLKLTRSLLNLVRQNLITMETLSDSTPTSRQPMHKPSTQPQASDKKFLVACIDDSANTCAMMQDIVESAGCQFLGIQDAFKALPTLLQHQPDLIFLDLIMPVVNGYEICAQIRRISCFQATPVVILTSNDGVVDRVRAKMVKASAFLSKPIEVQKIRTFLKKYQLQKLAQVEQETTEWEENLPPRLLGRQENQLIVI